MPDGDAPVGDTRPWLARYRVRLGFVLGAAALWLADPTRASLAAGGLVALVGAALRLWAAGHLDKGREVTTSGPYRWLRHPLYVGSSVLGVGVAVAAADPVVALLACLYLAATLTVAIKSEEADLRRKFGSAYEAYHAGRGSEIGRGFSVARVRANREHRAVLGLLAALALLGLKAWLR